MILIVSFIAFSCSKKDSTTSVSSSDNKTFNKRNYDKQEPIRPFGNLPTLKEPEPESAKYYNDYIDKRYGILEENDEYFEWLAQERKKRLESGRRNEFRAETMPSYNDYYIRKSKNADKINVPISQIRLKDIERKLEETKQRDVQEKKNENIDEIDDYEILAPMPDNEWNLKVKAYDYNE